MLCFRIYCITLCYLFTITDFVVRMIHSELHRFFFIPMKYRFACILMKYTVIKVVILHSVYPVIMWLNIPRCSWKHLNV